jgi:hypothetical protein
MRIAPFILASCAIAISASAETPRERFDFERWRAGVEFRTPILQRAELMRPRRRDTPLRYLNITAEEVQEIQLEAKDYMPRALVNISPVVTGCPCEEGSNCTDQVHIVATQDDKSFSMQLSRVQNAWRVSVVQKWWWQYEKLKARQLKMEWLDYDLAVTELALEYPMCSDKPAPATTASTQKAESKK